MPTTTFARAALGMEESISSTNDAVQLSGCTEYIHEPWLLDWEDSLDHSEIWQYPDIDENLSNLSLAVDLRKADSHLATGFMLPRTYF